MFILAVATSIDALAVGVTFAFLKVEIVSAVSFIGVITFVCSAAALSPMYLVLAVGIGLVLAWVIVSVMKSQLRSVAFQENAASYVREGSMNLTNSRELFLYRDVHRTERPKESSSSDSGGSSTHTSSNYPSTSNCTKS